MDITIIGAGYVGLTTSAALAYLGHKVHCIEQNKDRLKILQAGRIPFHEPGLAELLTSGLSLSFGGWDSFSGKSDIFLITVGTPEKENGEADIGQVEAAAREIARRVDDSCDTLVAIKSTVPLGTTKYIDNLIRSELSQQGSHACVNVAFNPEFLREGASLFDTLYPDRIAVGTNEAKDVSRLMELYRPILLQNFTPPACIPSPGQRKLPPMLAISPPSAELIKYAANAFLAMKISFINEFSGLAECVGADITEVSTGIGLDGRIGQKFLKAGAGWGGSCFGKDIKALLSTARKYDYEMHLVDATVKSNQRQKNSLVRKLEKQLQGLRGRNIGILGISFKPDTDDIRDAPFLYISKRLITLGARIKAYDPAAVTTCSNLHPSPDITYCNSPTQAAEDCDALLILTEWPEFRDLDYASLGQKMRKKIVLDGRNMLDPEALKKVGFTYLGVGRQC